MQTLRADYQDNRFSKYPVRLSEITEDERQPLRLPDCEVRDLFDNGANIWYGLEDTHKMFPKEAPIYKASSRRLLDNILNYGGYIYFILEK